MGIDDESFDDILDESPLPGDGPVPKAARASEGRVQVRPARFAPLRATAESAGQQGIDVLLDVPLLVTVELGRAQLTVKDVLALAKGAIVELNKVAGSPVDVLVNGTPVARGEVVVVDEQFAVRITELATPKLTGLVNA